MLHWLANNFMFLAKGAQGIVIGLAVGLKLIEPAVGWEGFGLWMMLVTGNAVIKDEQRVQGWLDRFKNDQND